MFGVLQWWFCYQNPFGFDTIWFQTRSVRIYKARIIIIKTQKTHPCLQRAKLTEYDVDEWGREHDGKTWPIPAWRPESADDVPRNPRSWGPTRNRASCAIHPTHRCERDDGGERYLKVDCVIRHWDSPLDVFKILTLEQSLLVLLLQREQLTSSLADLGECVLNAPYFTLVAQTELSDNFQLSIETGLFVRTTRCHISFREDRWYSVVDHLDNSIP